MSVSGVFIGFWRFWWEFLVGDTPDLTVGAIVVLGIVALAVPGVTWAFVIAPIGMALVVTGSLLREGRGR